MELFLNRAELSLNSGNPRNLINHLSMNWAQYKDPVSHMRIADTVVASWSLTQELSGSNHFTVTTNIFVTEFNELNSNSNVTFNR